MTAPHEFTLDALLDALSLQAEPAQCLAAIPDPRELGSIIRQLQTLEWFAIAGTVRADACARVHTLLLRQVGVCPPKVARRYAGTPTSAQCAALAVALSALVSRLLPLSDAV